MGHNYGKSGVQRFSTTGNLWLLLWVFKHPLYYYKKWFLMPKTEARIDIQNVVSTGSMNQKVDLNAVLKGYPDADYHPEQFPGLVFRLKKPKTATLIFSTGKMVCTGARSGAESRKAIMKVVKELKKGGLIILGKPSFKVVNIVASASLGGKVDLEQVVVRTRQTMYEPEQFPGLIYRMDEPKVVILVFASGNLVITGAKEEQDVYDAVHKLHESLEQQNLIFYE
jgi:transcription initiation factor TFIID TATA-box-binding protein